MLLSIAYVTDQPHEPVLSKINQHCSHLAYTDSEVERSQIKVTRLLDVLLVMVCMSLVLLRSRSLCVAVVIPRRLQRRHVCLSARRLCKIEQLSV